MVLRTPWADPHRLDKWQVAELTVEAAQKQLFALMGRNVGSTSDFFRVPPDAAVELGAELEI
jgi:K+ transporter